MPNRVLYIPPPLKFSPPSRPRGKMFYKNYWYKRSWSSELQLRIVAEYKAIIASTYQNMPIHRFQFSACLSKSWKSLQHITNLHAQAIIMQPQQW